MSSSTTELKVASNAQQHDNAFQAAQDIIEVISSTSPQNTIDYQSFESDPSATGYEQTLSISSPVVTYSGCKAQIGSSLEEGKGLTANFFRARATGTNNSASATSIQMQGIRFPAAACQ